ncbi:hypothetical protein [Methanobrevibacter arboriphilus]|nr:hypothetical protein [Methanobrevibacter arboriphilus]
MKKSKDIAQRVWNIAGDNRKRIGEEEGQSILTKRNAKIPELLDDEK